LISDEVMRLGEIDATDFARHTAVLRGFDRLVPVRNIHSVLVLATNAAAGRTTEG